MSVYVDDMRMPTRIGMMPSKVSHMFADSLDELEAMAERLELPAKWLQTKGSVVHYDLVDYKRKQAIELGAIPLEIDSDEWHETVRRIRVAQREGKP